VGETNRDLDMGRTDPGKTCKSGVALRANRRVVHAYRGLLNVVAESVELAAKKRKNPPLMRLALHCPRRKDGNHCWTRVDQVGKESHRGVQRRSSKGRPSGSLCQVILGACVLLISVAQAQSDGVHSSTIVAHASAARFSSELLLRELNASLQNVVFGRHHCRKELNLPL
jgi:hypothetical protein